jgi:endonuclease-3
VNHRNALELLVGVILSAQSTDKTVNELTPALFRKYPTARAFADAEPLDVEKMVYRAGFFRAKTKSILGACRMIVEKFGGEVPKTMDELLELPGIGRKSANVILGAAYGISSGIVVDTHMMRLANRFRLSRGEDPVKIEQDLIPVVPRKEWVYFSRAMVLHGRYICLARTPRCWECHLIKLCPYPDKILEPKETEKNTSPRKTITGIPIQVRVQSLLSPLRGEAVARRRATGRGGHYGPSSRQSNRQCT